MSVRYDWYQSETAVVVSVMLKDAKNKNYKVNIERQRLQVTADNYELDIKLNRPVNVERSSYEALTTKIEIRLAKEIGERWQTLEQKDDEPKIQQAAAVNSTAPVTKKSTKDWDKLAKDIEKSEEEEAQSEEALQRLFKKIYSSSSPEVRMAMNKSYSESGGTVLSTNWQDVSKERVEVKPPEGTEFRKWEE